VNKMDRTGANFFKVCGEIKDRLKSNAVPIQIPIGSEGDFTGIIDLVRMRAKIYTNDLGTDILDAEVPADMAEEAQKYRSLLLEAVAESDEELLDKYLAEEELQEAEIIAAIRQATIQGAMVPVLCGSAFKNRGVQVLLDAVVDYLPSPIDVPPIEGELSDGSLAARPANDDEPAAALAFKVAADSFGRLTFIRVYSGTLSKGSYIYNSTKGKKERLSRLIILKSNDRIEVDELRAGDLGGIVGLKDTTTGDTLCDAKAPIVLESIFIPEPVISVAVEPKTKADMDRLSKALQSLSDEDPTFRVSTDPETNQTVIAGMGELHLEILVDRMLREFKVEANIGQPQVAYRETIRSTARADKKFVRQSGGKGQYGHVVLDIAPGELASGFEFTSKIVGGTIPKEYIPAIEAGVKETLEAGVIAGYPTIDVKATLIDGSYHDVDSSEMAFKIAGSMAMREAVTAASPALLEPIMQVDVEVPEEFLGDVIGDLNARRGQVGNMLTSDSYAKVAALVPLSEMFGYATDIRSKTQGRGIFSMEFSRYEEVPRHIAEAIQAKNQGNA
ncbi:MAG: elongation factor G, partial [Cyanobacteria bacterium J06641_5]